MTEPFFLDVEYKTLTHSSQLKFETMELEIHNPFALGIFSLISFICIPLMLLVFYFLITELILDLQFRTEGVATQISITSCHMQRWGKNSHAPRVSYIYTVNGVEYSDIKLIPRNNINCDNFPAETLLDGVFIKSNPSQSKITAPISNYEWGGMVNAYFGLTMITFIFVLGSVYMPIAAIRSFIGTRRYNRLLKNGQRLQGEIVTIKGEKRGTEKKFHVEVVYQVVTPEGKTLTGKQSKQRQHLTTDSLPAPGTPVWVLYADDHAHVML